VWVLAFRILSLGSLADHRIGCQPVCYGDDGENYLVCERAGVCDHEDKCDHHQILLENQDGDASHGIPQVRNGKIRISRFLGK